jgi:hypothetical protein
LPSVPSTTLKLALKRGALVVAANWHVVIVQFVADVLFKTLLAVPLVGGGVLVVLLVGGDPADLLGLEMRHVLPTIAGVLLAHPVALAAFLGALAVVVAGGSTLMFLVKGGTVTVLLAGERSGGSLEQPPLRLATVRRATQFSLDRFTAGSRALFGRYLRLGLWLCAIYAVSVAAYLLLVFGGTPAEGSGWRTSTALASLALLGWIGLVNLIYLLCQIAMAADGGDVTSSMRRVFRFMLAERRLVAMIFGAILALVMLTTAASILATAALGLVAFVPLVGLAALPLQLLAWVLRGLVFQFIGLSGLTAYARVYRSWSHAAEHGAPPAPVHQMRTA